MVRSISFACAVSTSIMFCGISYAGGNNNQIPLSEVQQGAAITPVPLNLSGKSPAQCIWAVILLTQVETVAAATPFRSTSNKVAQAAIPLLVIPMRGRHQLRAPLVN
jgi:hypothetical protein